VTERFRLTADGKFLEAFVKLIFNSCGVGMGCKSLIFQESRVGFRKNVVPRRGVLWLIILAYDEIMC